MCERCEYCWSSFKNVKYLEHHQRIAKYCQNYKYVVFTCRKCNFSTRGIRNIEQHIKECVSTREISDDPMLDLQKRIKELEEENSAYKAKLSNVKESISSIEEIKNLLRLETFKNKIYRHIITSNTSIQIGDVVEEKEDGLHIFNYQGGDIPIFVNECLKGGDGVVKNKLLPTSSIAKHSPKRIIVDDEKPKKKSYRPIKSVEQLVPLPPPPPLPPSVSPPSVPKISVENESIVLEQVEELKDLEKVQKDFERCFYTLKQSRNYTKVLEELRSYRNNVMDSMNITEYRNLVLSHIDTITQIFQEKNYSEKKYVSIIFKGLSPLESRITTYGQYITQHLEVEEIQKLQTILELNTPDTPEYVPFDINNVYFSLQNYGSVLFPIQKNLERVLFNKYGYNNIIYLPLAKNTEDDPYSFYTLDKVNKDNKYWKMDCRLEDFIMNIISQVLPFLITTFRKIYKDIFNDNEFRPNYSSHSQITECDCEQLLLNILLLGQPKEFCNCMRRLVKRKAPYKPSEKNDKFNLQGDDSLQRKRFQEKDDIDLVDVVKQLFDGITAEDAVDFYRSKI